ncbi:MAG: hypothetical protein HY824_05170 [Acidobacteria bacterium]|nr:hypothetical protein [Acidobacteriota bacterium]
MRILFLLPLTSYVRHFDSVVLALADRGHEVRIATPGNAKDWPLPEALEAHPRVSQGTCPAGRADAWNGAATDLRLLGDYLRYLEEPFAPAGKLRARAFRELLEGISRHTKRPAARCGSCGTRVSEDDLSGMLRVLGDNGVANLRRLFELTETAIPSDDGRERYLAAERPDVVLVTPLVGFGSDQADWVKSARAMGIPVGFPVFSWDNLTTKGVVHVRPDRVFVWNDIQKHEAIEHHGIPEAAIDVTGAPRFDAFFDLAPASDRRRFCAKVGLNPDAPIVTWLCSSEFVARREVELVDEWIREIRTDPALAACSVIVRPHPRGLRQWEGVDAGRWERAAITLPHHFNADRWLYNTLFHSAAVVALNTSAQLEAAIVGRPVYTMLAPGFEPGQQGTLHFRYLLAEEGGVVEVARDFAEHRQHLAAAVAGRYDAERIRAFAERFVRPQGWAQPSTPVLADAIERLRSGGPPPGMTRQLSTSESR